ncbi:methyltransferase domain-containing protein [Natronoflexus pectinivorans]|uniref:Methyltransferase family protein n=1 Tax=Natronoflexus pectinivorans TaxID=682526 RepID=A0A4R2GSA0_9BACT|nr:methyltransferase domain-containing protein [Natronoflexus pectinivorans]TCO11076.1 methyltransferase family protein [Natronoflexus pectinivorans]
MTTKFKYRSYKQELLDETNIQKNLLFKNLWELDIMNRNTGGHAITLKGIKQLVTDHTKLYHIVDFGCGSGDSLRTIADWARKNNFNVQLTGVDKNANVIDYLRKHCRTYPEITGIIADHQVFIDQNRTVDIVHCSLFCHHLNENELLKLFTYFSENVKVGFVVNDLQRNWMAYYSAWFFTRLLNGTVLAKNDGPISVLRAFKFSELKYLLEKANIKNYIIEKKQLFRFLVVGKTSNYGTFSA